MEILSKNSGHTTGIPYKNWHGKPYYSLDAYCKNTYGEKLYKVALNAGLTCPNRDGTLGTGGCIFCSAGGSGDFAASTADTDSAFEQAFLQRKPVRNLLLTFRLTPTPTVLFPIWKKYTGLPLRSLLLREFPLPPGRTVCLTMLWRCYAG